MATRAQTHGLFLASIFGLIFCVGAVFLGIRPSKTSLRHDSLLSAVADPARASGGNRLAATDPFQQLRSAPKMAIELSNDTLMEKLRTAVDANPTLALQLAQESESRFGEINFADERAFLRMRAHVNLRDIAAARAVAEQFYRRYPESPFAERVYRLTGMHPPATASATAR